MAPNTPAGPAHLNPPLATSIPAECPLKSGNYARVPSKGPLKGSGLGPQTGLQRASAAGGSEAAACGFRIRWQRQAMPAPAQNLEGTGNP